MNKTMSEKIHVGYILPDLQQPEIACISYCLLTAFNRDEFQVYCYTDGNIAKLKEVLENPNLIWRSTDKMSVELIVRGMKKDRLDILVDLSSHTVKHCLQIMTRKPAGVQMSSLGYFHTTGLKTVEYLLTDTYCNPRSEDQTYLTEELLYLPQSHFCYRPMTQIGAYHEAPVQRNGYVTFGCFHQFTRVNDAVLMLWQSVIAEVPHAHLVLKNRIFGSGYGCQETRFRLKRLGFDLERIELRSPGSDEIEDYQDIDILLDTCPYQGAKTTCDALYMGIPVMVIAGKRHSGRFGYSILRNIGLDECLAEDTVEYVKKLITLANNPCRIVHLHRILRERLVKSPLMDEKRYMLHIERIYKKVLRRKANKLQFETTLQQLRRLLQTMEEGLAYAYIRLCKGDIAEVVLQIFDDIIVGLKNAEVALAYIDEEDRTATELIKKCNKARQLCKSNQSEKTVLMIDQELMPAVKAMLQRIR